jgi:hypothetical protein
MSSLGFVLIVACLLGDMATPLCPGVFRFDSAHSIQAVGSRAVTSLTPDLKAPSLPQREVDATYAPLLRAAGARMAAHPSRPLRWRTGVVPVQTDLASPRRSEDG